VKGLNSEQRRAVETTAGPVMVLAGAGSGKTRVIAHRIANLIASRTVRADKILALTFTNKAAEEMRRRIETLVPGNRMPRWVGTFHSLFARILRMEARAFGYTAQFSIYDEADQIRAIKDVIRKGSLPVGELTPRSILNIISRQKSRLITAAAYAEKESGEFPAWIVAPVYTAYAAYLRVNNAMDFDDLLMSTYMLFKNNPKVLSRYQNKFKYLLVDEFQDTNLAQYRILLQLADKSRNICVVGDDDQSIYGWRGAEIKNILQFEHDFDNTVVIRLEQNYRSTKNILTAANSVIKNNLVRHVKKLWTERPCGDKITINYARSDYNEADWVAQSIVEKVSKEGRSWADFAVLYRMNAQSRLIEDSLRRESIPYTIVGGHKFYERKEIKDVLAYLCLLINPEDEVALKRIINFPPRGIGKQTIQKLEEYAGKNEIAIFDAMKSSGEIAGIQKKRSETIINFHQLITKYRKLLKRHPMVELVTALIEEVKILQYLQAERIHETVDRLENVRELLRAIEEYAVKNPDATLENYLSEIALTADIDYWDDEAQHVSLMTVHAAKGLEFPVVFVTGMEEGIFPTSSSLEDQRLFEEERRLFYVAATRAEESLYISAAERRSIFDGLKTFPPSPFLNEIDPDTVYKPDYEPALSLYSPRKKAAFTYAEPDVSGSKQQEHEKYAVGMRVQHPDFGIGVINKIDGTGNKAKLHVVFQGNIAKKLLVQYATLTVVDGFE